MARVQFKLWVEEEGKVLFGEGRLALLQAVHEAGSLAGAARQMSMSYRAAWGRLRASESRLGFSLLERRGKGRREVRLTEQALKLMARHRAMEKEAERLAAKYQKQWDQELAALRGKEGAA
ncbi:MAG: LysR family transcriptional regulator [Desulfarculaceae bacterium]|nr:LysR family transcriptional regulator [Desulfarculaceae bacterium]